MRINPVGPRARAAALGLGCLGFVTLALAIFSGIAFLYAFLPGHRFPFDALVGVALPVILIGLGIWTWRERSVGALPSVIAIGVGISALVLIALFVLVGLISLLH